MPSSCGTLYSDTKLTPAAPQRWRGVTKTPSGVTDSTSGRQRGVWRGEQQEGGGLTADQSPAQKWSPQCGASKLRITASDTTYLQGREPGAAHISTHNHTPTHVTETAHRRSKPIIWLSSGQNEHNSFGKWHVYSNYLRKLVIIFPRIPRIKKWYWNETNTVTTVTAVECLRGRGTKSWEDRTGALTAKERKQGLSVGTVSFSGITGPFSRSDNHETK